MSRQTKQVRQLRVRKAKEILEELNRRIDELEDQAVKVWYENGSAYTVKAEMLQIQLTERYTCRRVLEGWLSRHACKRSSFCPMPLLDPVAASGLSQI